MSRILANLSAQESSFMFRPAFLIKSMVCALRSGQVLLVPPSAFISSSGSKAPSTRVATSSPNSSLKSDILICSMYTSDRKINKTVGIIEKRLPAPYTTRKDGANRDGHPGRVKAIKTNSILSYLELTSFKVDTIPINITRYSPSRVNWTKFSGPS